jgi:hypothetical protein
MNKLIPRITLCLTGWFLMAFLASAQSFFIYTDVKISQHEFAATEIQRALDSEVLKEYTKLGGYP